MADISSDLSVSCFVRNFLNTETYFRHLLWVRTYKLSTRKKCVNKAKHRDKSSFWSRLLIFSRQTREKCLVLLFSSLCHFFLFFLGSSFLPKNVERQTNSWVPSFLFFILCLFESHVVEISVTLKSRRPPVFKLWLSYRWTCIFSSFPLTLQIISLSKQRVSCFHLLELERHFLCFCFCSFLHR